MKRRFLMVAAALIVAAALALVAYTQVAQPNRFIIRNSTGASLDGVHLTIRSKDDGQTVKRDVPSLEPGHEVVVRHGMKDLSIEMRFGRSGKEYEHSEPYVDLWGGEGWVVDVQSDGTVKSGYESVMQSSVRRAPR